MKLQRIHGTSGLTVLIQTLNVCDKKQEIYDDTHFTKFCIVTLIKIFMLSSTSMQALVSPSIKFAVNECNVTDPFKARHGCQLARRNSQLI